MRLPRSAPSLPHALLLLALLAPAVPAGVEKDIKKMKPDEQLRYLRRLNKEKRGGEIDILFRMGNAFYSLGQADSAVVYYRLCLQADSTDSKKWVNLGMAYDAQGQFARAEQAFKKALDVNEKDVMAYCHLGYLYYSHGRYQEAIDNYRRALAVDPQSPLAHYNLGLAFAEAKIFAEAVREWSLAVRYAPPGQLKDTAEENLKLIKQYLQMEKPR